jgi:hypothetical protein
MSFDWFPDSCRHRRRQCWGQRQKQERIKKKALPVKAMHKSIVSSFHLQNKKGYSRQSLYPSE